MKIRSIVFTDETDNNNHIPL